MRTVMKLACCALAMAVFALPFAAGTVGAAEGKKVKIGVCLPNLNIPHWVFMKWKYEQDAAANNVDLTFVQADGYENVEKQINLVQDFISAEMDAIIIAAVDAQALVNVIGRAVDAGIPVIEVNNLTRSDRSYVKIKSDDYEMGRRQAGLMNKALGGKGKVVMINAPGGTTLAVRGQGFRETVEKEYPGIEILAEQFVPSDPARCTAVMEDFIQTYPEMNGVFCWSDTAGIAAASVATAQSSQITITAMDANNIALRDFIRAGVIYGTVAQQPMVLAHLSFEYALKAVRGEDNPVKNVFADIIDVTGDNIAGVDYSGILRTGDKW